MQLSQCTSIEKCSALSSGKAVACSVAVVLLPATKIGQTARTSPCPFPFLQEAVPSSVLGDAMN